MVEYPNSLTMGHEQHLWCVCRILLFKSVDVSIGTTHTGAWIPDKQVINRSFSKYCRLEHAVIRKTHHWTANLSLHKYIVLLIVSVVLYGKTMLLTFIENGRCWVFLKEKLAFEVYAVWYLVIVAAWGTFQLKWRISGYTQICKNQAKAKLQTTQTKVFVAKPGGEVCYTNLVLATVSVLDPAGIIGLRGNGLTPSKIDDFLSEPSL
jgi:hypothetical protein